MSGRSGDAIPPIPPNSEEPSNSRRRQSVPSWLREACTNCHGSLRTVSIVAGFRGLRRRAGSDNRARRRWHGATQPRDREPGRRRQRSGRRRAGHFVSRWERLGRAGNVFDDRATGGCEDHIRRWFLGRQDKPDGVLIQLFSLELRRRQRLDLGELPVERRVNRLDAFDEGRVRGEKPEPRGEGGVREVKVAGGFRVRCVEAVLLQPPRLRSRPAAEWSGGGHAPVARRSPSR